MGQELFNPPSVKGWDGGQAWINSRTLMARMGFTGELTGALTRRGTLTQIALGDLASAMVEDSSRKDTPKSAAPRPFPTLEAATPKTGAMENTMMAPEVMAGGMAMQGKTSNAPKLNAQQLAALSPEKVVDTLWETLLTGQEPRATTRAALLDYVGDGKGNIAEKLPGLVNLIMASPEYQLI